MGRRRAQPVSGNTGKLFDEPTTQKAPAFAGCVPAAARGVAALDRISRYALRAAPGVRLARTQRSRFNPVPTCSSFLEQSAADSQAFGIRNILISSESWDGGDNKDAG